ncbi:ABC transporter permease [Bacillus pretiosus]|uniref:FtsX-like permease family protein n=1 Tax=Bacillus pretiosus TaxID=2983392 RepID=A0ABT3ENQ5_9BACI|nr:FtsX-like permease family protein [Bacillus pretiosus]MCW1238453.1 FtsX-like permease family protein [Bacillus pretiosus]
MWKKKIKNSKLSFFLIAVILMVTSSLLSTSRIFIDNINNSITDYYSNPKFPDVYLFNSSKKEMKLLEEKASEGKIIKDLQEYKAMYSSMNINKLNNEKFNEDRNLIISIKNIKDLNWKLTILEGENNPSPGHGEIWISKILADKKDLRLNDIIEIDKANGSKFKVSAIINDSQNASLANPAKIMYINEKDVNLFDKEVTGEFAVFKYASEKEDVTKYIHDNFASNKYYMEKYYLILNQLADTGLVSVVMTLAGILTLISGIIVVMFTLRNNLKKEVKSIGTYKALGFKASEIKKIYSKAYLFVGVISTTIGVAISFPAAYILQKNILKYLGDFGYNIRYLIIGGIIIAFFNVIIQLFVTLELRKIKKISPIEAISMTGNPKGGNRSWVLFRNTNNPIALSINDILKDRRLSLNVCVITTIYMFTTLLFINTNHMFAVSNENANIWLNLHKTTATINTNITSQEMENDIVNYLNKDRKVENYGYGLYLNAGNYIKYDSEKYGALDVYAIESFSTYDNLGFEIYEGRLPGKFNEINVSIQMLSDTNLKIGDKMNFKINGKDEEFLIVGSFGSIKYGGRNVRLLNEAMKHYNFKPDYNTIVVQLENKKYYDDFKKDFEKKFKGTSVQADLGNYNQLLKDMTSMVPPVVTIISVFMLILSALNIITIISIIMMDERRKIGIQKALGFTSRFLKVRILSRIAILTLVGIAAAICMHEIISKPLIELVITSPNAIIFSLTKTILYCFVTFFVMLLFAFIGTLRIERINAIELMEE